MKIGHGFCYVLVYIVSFKHLIMMVTAVIFCITLVFVYNLLTRSNVKLQNTFYIEQSICFVMVCVHISCKNLIVMVTTVIF